VLAGPKLNYISEFVFISSEKCRNFMYTDCELRLTSDEGQFHSFILLLQYIRLWGYETHSQFIQPVWLGLEFVFFCFLGCMIYLYVGVCFVLPWTVESLPFMFWRWRNKLKW